MTGLKYIFVIFAAAALTFGCESSLDTALDDTGKDNDAGQGGGETPGEEETPETYFYSILESAPADWSGDYIIAANSSDGLAVFDSWSDRDGGASTMTLGPEALSEGVDAKEGDPVKAVIAKVGTGYSIYVTSVGYIGLEKSANSLNCSDTEPSAGSEEYLWTLSLSSSGQGVCVVTNMKYDSRSLQWNSSASLFRCYTGGQQDIVLFRRNSSDGNIGEQPGGDGEDPDGDGDGEGDIDNPDPVPGISGKFNWFELPVIPDSDGNRIDDNDASLYYAYHMCAGGEKDDKGRTARNYTVCYSAEHHCPVWVAAPRHEMYETEHTDRTDAYGQDPDIPGNIQYNSKSTGGGCNKGHMLGSAERLSSSATNRQVFYYTNIAPQLSSTFNTGGGAWNNLEDHIDGLVCADTLYEVVGCYFEKFTDSYGKSTDPQTISFGGRNDVSRPTMFYYALLRTKDGNTGKSVTECSSDQLQCVAFCIRHTMEKEHTPQAKDMMSVSDLEKLTGFTYFPNVPAAPKDSFNPSDWL